MQDEIARGLSPFNPENMAIEAGRLMLQRINGIGKSTKLFYRNPRHKILPALSIVHKNKGYKVNLIYFWLSSPDLAIQRSSPTCT